MLFDDVTVHAAVIAINDAVDHGDPAGTLAAMRNPNAMLLNLDATSAQYYQDMLYHAKAEKVANSRKRVRVTLFYTFILTHLTEAYLASVTRCTLYIVSVI